jgi:glucan phosphoethanolaminetransferase (alkaline phosphatase superfamily)
MAENQPQPKSSGKTFKLFLVIFLCLAVPIAMDQFDIDREQVRLAGRIAVGVTGLLFLYGLFTKMLKVMAFVVVLLITLVFLVAEGHVKAPHVREWFADKTAARK